MTVRTVTLEILVMLLALLPASGYAQQDEGGLQIGHPFPNIALPDLDGNRRSVADFRGHKLILHVFASW